MADVAAPLRPRRRTRRAGRDTPVVRHVAQALADGQAIHWDGADALGRTPQERTLTRELRTLAWLSTQSDVHGLAGTADTRGPQSPVLEGVLPLIAAGQVLIALGTLAWAMTPTLALLIQGAATVSCAAAAGVLLLRARRDGSARTLGHLLIVVAAALARPLLESAAGATAPLWLRAWWHGIHVEAFLPLVLWRVAREYPRVVRFTRFDIWSRRALMAAGASSVVLAAAGAVAAFGVTPDAVGAPWWRGWRRQTPLAPFAMVVAAWAIATTFALAARGAAGGGGRGERVRYVMWALAVGVLPATWAVAGDAAGPALADQTDAGDRAWRTAAWLHAIAVVTPWMVTLPVIWQAVANARPTWRGWIAARVPAILGTVVLLAGLVPLTQLLARRGEPVSQVLDDRQVLASLFVAAAASVLLGVARLFEAHASRRRRQRGRHGSGIAGVAADMARARTPREIAATLVQHAREALETDGAAVLMAAGPTWLPVAGVMRPLPSASAVVALLDASGEPMDVSATGRLFPLLPSPDRAWLQGSGVVVVAGIASADGHLLAALVLGMRRDGRPYCHRDLAFVAAIVGTAAVALEAEAARRAQWPRVREVGDEEELAYECPACGAVAQTSGACTCGGLRALACLPARVGGKFVLDRRIGSGGMGVVYLATDERLGRRVALKTLPRPLPGAAAAMHAEARAMAAIAHPAVAVLYELHVWRDTPVLGVEYLAGGTVAAQLTAGPLPARDVVALGTSLADALTELHAAGWLHGDIKPSNIGHARVGGPKLLDFGLTRLVAHARPRDGAAADRHADGTPALRGTPLYLSPEAFDGHPPAAHMDVWALSLVLFEMATGVHPFQAASIPDVVRKVCHSRSVDVHACAPGVPAALAQLLEQALDPRLSERISSAADLAAALRSVAGRI